MRRMLGIAAALAALASPAARAITVENYQKYRLDARNVQATFKSLLEVRMEGVLQGLIIANRNVSASGGKPLFCAPENLQMRGAEVLKLLDEEITNGRDPQGQPYAATAQIEDALLAMASKRWPCPR